MPTHTEAPMGVLKLTVSPLWNGQPFSKDSIYLAAGDQRIQVSGLKFYLAPLALHGEQGGQLLFDADLFDVANGPEYRVLAAPSGAYQSVATGLGLPYHLNHRDLATIPPNAPTGNNSGMYWNWASQYRFTIFTGKWDSDPVGLGTPPFTFDLHTGLDTCYRTRSWPLDLNVPATDTARMTITVDIARFFTDGTDVFNLAEGAVWHGDVNELDVVLELADLQVEALSVEAE
ncbi:MAG: hypothetical protein KBH07_14395 [Flavobacteriales bacterium]|nr:hypothetical protein [Flavobacteriales bacterium]MBP9080428.1 hypothetical protein [Flavobacteriales bacterium]